MEQLDVVHGTMWHTAHPNRNAPHLDRMTQNKQNIPPVTQDPFGTINMLGTARMPIGANFLVPFDAVRRRQYLLGFDRPTIGYYNNHIRNFPMFNSTNWKKWVDELVEREQRALQQLDAED